MESGSSGESCDTAAGSTWRRPGRLPPSIYAPVKDITLHGNHRPCRLIGFHPRHIDGKSHLHLASTCSSINVFLPLILQSYSQFRGVRKTTKQTSSKTKFRPAVSTSLTQQSLHQRYNEMNQHTPLLTGRFDCLERPRKK